MFYFRFETKQWYHLTITHTFSKMEWLNVLSTVGKSALKFYVDGQLVHETAIKFPDLEVCYLKNLNNFENFNNSYRMLLLVLLE